MPHAIPNGWDVLAKACCITVIPWFQYPPPDSNQVERLVHVALSSSGHLRTVPSPWSRFLQLRLSVWLRLRCPTHPFPGTVFPSQGVRAHSPHPLPLDQPGRHSLALFIPFLSFLPLQTPIGASPCPAKALMSHPSFSHGFAPSGI